MLETISFFFFRSQLPSCLVWGGHAYIISWAPLSEKTMRRTHRKRMRPWGVCPSTLARTLQGHAACKHKLVARNLHARTLARNLQARTLARSLHAQTLARSLHAQTLARNLQAQTSARGLQSWTTGTNFARTFGWHAERRGPRYTELCRPTQSCVTPDTELCRTRGDLTDPCDRARILGKARGAPKEAT